MPNPNKSHLTDNLQSFLEEIYTDSVKTDIPSTLINLSYLAESDAVSTTTLNFKFPSENDIDPTCQI